MSDVIKKIAVALGKAIRSADLGYLLTEEEITLVTNFLFSSMEDEIASDGFNTSLNSLVVAILKEREKPAGDA